MSCTRYTFALSTVFALAYGAGADAQQAQRAQQRPAAAGLSGPLVGGDLQEKLKLTSEQKEKLAKIEAEFSQKAKDSEATVRELAQKARQDKDRAARQKLQQMMEEGRKLREDYRSKVTAMLNVEQKKTFEAGQTDSGRPGARPGAAQANPFLPPAVRDRLKLTPEQVEKLNALQKDFEAKSLNVLTEEQRKQYEELRKGRTRPKQSSRRMSSASKGSVVTLNRWYNFTLSAATAC